MKWLQPRCLMRGGQWRWYQGSVSTLCVVRGQSLRLREGRGCAVSGCVLARTGPEVVSSDWDGLGGGALTRACGRCDEQTEWLTFIGMAVASALLPLLM